MMEDVMMYLPYLIPIILLHYGMAIYSLILMIRTKNMHPLYRILWGMVILFVQIIGPILYLVFGRRER